MHIPLCFRHRHFTTRLLSLCSIKKLSHKQPNALQFFSVCFVACMSTKWYGLLSMIPTVVAVRVINYSLFTLVLLNVKYIFSYSNFIHFPLSHTCQHPLTENWILNSVFHPTPIFHSMNSAREWDLEARTGLCTGIPRIYFRMDTYSEEGDGANPQSQGANSCKGNRHNIVIYLANRNDRNESTCDLRGSPLHPSSLWF